MDWQYAYPDYFVFDEDEVFIKNVKLDKSSCVIFDVKRYNFVSKTSGDFGFAVYPLVSDFQNRIYMNSGVFQLTLYQGKVPSNFIALLQNDPSISVQDRLKDFIASKEIKPFYDPISVVVKVCDN